MAMGREYCELNNWSRLQDSLLQQITSSKRDVNKNQLRRQMEIFSIPEYMKKVNEIDRKHEKRLRQNQKWQVLQNKRHTEYKNIRAETEKSVLERRENVSPEKKKLNKGIEKKCIVKEQIPRSSDKKIFEKFRKTEIHSKNQKHFKIATSPSKNISSSTSTSCFLITKLSPSTTLIKKLPASEKFLAKSRQPFTKSKTLSASTYPVSSNPSMSQTEISSETSQLTLNKLKTSFEIAPGTSKTMIKPRSLFLSEESESYLNLSITAGPSSQPIKQYGPSSKHSSKSVESATSEPLIKSITLSTNSFPTPTEKTDFCSSETMMNVNFHSLLTKLSFHSEWTEPEIYHTPKFTDLTESHDSSQSDMINPFHLDVRSIYFSPHFTASQLSFEEL